MQQRYKLILVALFTVVTSGCTSNNSKQAVDDFTNGAIHNAEHRQQQQAKNPHRPVDNAPKMEDAIVGFFNIGFQSFVRMFKSAEPE